MKKPQAQTFAVVCLSLLLAGCDNQRGLDVTGDGQPDGLLPKNGECPPRSHADRPHADGYCYPG
ncbi:hypothetical protein [Pseudomonas silesiensis]|uniref:hypothetical protein n=1 Tax=Pseudomonas silesiensis TaxID=1853130 RepID=UPI0034D65E1F